ncbi:MAG: tetratricopeptide repeat protein [Prochloraceae cyanobacterium]
MTGTSFAQANKFFQEGKLEEAIALYKKATTKSPQFYWSYHNLGEALIKAGRIEEAVAAFRQSLVINPESAWSLYKFGVMLNKLGQYEEAVGYLRQAVELITNVPEFYFALGSALVQLGQWSEAEEFLYKVVQFSPDSLPLNEQAKKVHRASVMTFYVSEAYFYFGEIKSGQQQWSEAVEFYRQSWENNPGKLECCMGLAASLGKLGQWSEAVECYRQRASLFDESGEFLFRFGQALGQLQRWDEAIVEYRKAINLGYAGAEVRHHLGYALGQLGRWSEAVVEYRLVLEVNPKSAVVRHQLGYALGQLGRWREAEVELRKSVELHPGSAVVRQQLADVLRELGEKDEAVNENLAGLQVRISEKKQERNQAFTLVPKKVEAKAKVSRNLKLDDQNLGEVLILEEQPRAGLDKSSEVLSNSIIGSLPLYPVVSIIIPLYTNLDCLGRQLAAIAKDGDFEKYEIIYVLNLAEKVKDVEAVFREYCTTNELSARLMVVKNLQEFEAAVRIASLYARGRYLLLMPAYVIPQGRGWLKMTEFYESVFQVGTLAPQLLDENRAPVGVTGDCLLIAKDLYDNLHRSRNYGEGLTGLDLCKECDNLGYENVSFEDCDFLCLMDGKG